jgi:hypothetical protein
MTTATCNGAVPQSTLRTRLLLPTRAGGKATRAHHTVAMARVRIHGSATTGLFLESCGRTHRDPSHYSGRCLGFSTCPKIESRRGIENAGGDPLGVALACFPIDARLRPFRVRVAARFELGASLVAVLAFFQWITARGWSKSGVSERCLRHHRVSSVEPRLRPGRHNHRHGAVHNGSRQAAIFGEHPGSSPP